MQPLTLVALLLVARVASAEQPQEVSNSQPVPVVQPQGVSVASNGEQSPAGPQPQYHVHDGVTYPGGQHTQAHSPAHYAASGLIQMVGPAEANKQQIVHHYAAGPNVVGGAEQYGQPEAAGVPPNYKPFGSWGLYIGGNPADGYYSNYYKSLSNSVEKQQVSGEQVKPAVAPVAGGQQADVRQAFQPVLKQASYNSYQDQVYPFDYYTPADLNSGSRVSVSPVEGPSSYASGRVFSPAQVGGQVYGVEQPQLSYADSYSTKRLGQFAQKEQQQQVQVPVAKGQQQQQYQYAYAAYAPFAQPQQSMVAPNQPQVVAYPVPVGSQIVGSQPGVEGSFQPYGVHGFTRYAIKPTVVGASEQSYYHQGVHSSPVSQFPAYKQQQPQAQSQQAVVHHQPAPVVHYQPLSFYGYPLSQLHYSQGSIVPAFGQQSAASGPQVSPVQAQGQPQPVGHQEGPAVAHSPMGSQVEAAGSEKSESEVEKGSGVAKHQ